MNARRRILYPTLVLIVLGSSLIAVGPASAACDLSGKSAVVEATSDNVEAIIACGREAQTSIAFGPKGTLAVAIPPVDESLALDLVYPEGSTGLTSAVVSRFKDGGIGFAYELGGQRVVGGDKQGIDKMTASLAKTSSPSVPAAFSSGCSSSSYTTRPYYQVNSFHYSINVAGIPSGGASRINAAASAIAAASDNCGLAGSTGIPAVYDGTTTYTTNVTFSGGCATQDSISVQKFGNVSSTVPALGFNCTSYNGAGWVLHTDTLYNNAYAWFTGAGLTGCAAGSYDLQGVATHEIGHSYGLGHAGDATQVMYLSTPPCDTGDRLLGSGDHAGLMFIY